MGACFVVSRTTTENFAGSHVGWTASAIYAEHRFSRDADDHNILTDLCHRFDEALAQLESVAGWKTTRTKEPVLILGNLDGVGTGVRQFIRSEPLEIAVIDRKGMHVTVPTEGEILRIKGILIFKHNAVRDYLDFVSLADHMGHENVVHALQSFDRL